MSGERQDIYYENKEKTILSKKEGEKKL